MAQMIKDILVQQVKKVLTRSINRLATEHKVDTLFLKIAAQDQTGIPKLMIYNEDARIHREIPFTDLVTTFDKQVYLAMGFNLERELPIWIRKFLIKCSEDNDFEITFPFYLIATAGNDLKAFMYVNNEQHSEIPINYILTTK